MFNKTEVTHAVLRLKYQACA